MSTNTNEATPFIGRRRELAELRQSLASARLVTLTGVGGAGKTRLAQRLAQGERAFEATWTVLLADVLEPHVVALTVVESIGLTTQPPDDPAQALATFIGDRQVLLVLDNCEQVRDASAALASRLLAHCPRLRIIVTSRQSLGVSGEVVYPVPPLSVPPQGTRGVRLDDLDQYDGVTLFLSRAASAMPGFVATETTAGAIARLCEELEGLPLALELAAARIPVLTPEVMIERLHDRYQLLSRGYADTPGRQRSLQASVSWSYDLCSPQEQLLWARLSIFSGGFGLEAAEHVCSGGALAAEDVLDVLSDLIDKSIVVRDPGDGLHYRMLETLRQYGVARLAEAGESPALRERHRQWFIDLAYRLGPEWMGPNQARWLDHWRRNHANLRLILEDTAPDADEAPIALRLVLALEGYWLVSGHLAEARHWLDLALSHGAGEDVERAGAMSMCAYLGSIQTDWGYARDNLSSAEALLTGSTDDMALGYLAFTTGSMHLFAGEMKSALVAVEESIERFRRIGHVNHVVVALMIAGLCHTSLGNPEAAARAKAESLEMTERAGELYTRSLVLWSLAIDARDLGHLDAAAGLQIRALYMKWSLRDQPGLAVVFEALASIESARGAGERAATLLGAAAKIWSLIQANPVSAPFIAAERETAEALARKLLQDKAFEEAFRCGQAMTQKEAVDFAAGKPAPVATSLRDRAASDNPLTARESEVAQLIGQGLTNQDIATRLVISVRTAQGHVENILRKLGFTSRSQVAAWVAKRDQG